jgi:hypothetical protein
MGDDRHEEVNEFPQPAVRDGSGGRLPIHPRRLHSWPQRSKSLQITRSGDVVCRYLVKGGLRIALLLPLGVLACAVEVEMAWRGWKDEELRQRGWSSERRSVVSDFVMTIAGESVATERTFRVRARATGEVFAEAPECRPPPSSNGSRWNSAATTPRSCSTTPTPRLWLQLSSRVPSTTNGQVFRPVKSAYVPEALYDCVVEELANHALSVTVCGAPEEDVRPGAINNQPHPLNGREVAPEYCHPKQADPGELAGSESLPQSNPGCES